MKKAFYLLITPTLFALASCGNNLPRRKSGQFCNVTFTSEVVESDCPTFAPMDRDLQIHLDIPYLAYQGAGWDIEPTEDKEGVLTYPNIEYTVTVDDIHVYIAGKEYPDAFTYFQQSNGFNVLTIKKDYVVNDMSIDVVARPRDYLYLFGYELGEELDKRRSDNIEEGPEYTHDLIVNFDRAYQNTKKPIKTLSGQAAYPVFEHDEIDVTFSLIPPAVNPEGQEPLPDDLRYRCNARYTLEGTDYTREYDDPYTYKYIEAGVLKTKIGYRTCRFHVPYMVVNDHGSFRQFGTE